LRIREVGCGSDDSEASWLIYITIWQLVRRKGRSRKTGGWPTGKENKYQRPRRHLFYYLFGFESDYLLASIIVKF